MGPHERGMRFLEEALELAQAVGVNLLEVERLTDSVYAKPKGQVAQEIGGVGTTLLALAESQNLSAYSCIMAEIERIHLMPIEKFRKRQELNAARGLGKSLEV
jgi:NTP pyrophosphatase (non-canonical NTP hydrolase)